MRSAVIKNNAARLCMSLLILVVCGIGLVLIMTPGGKFNLKNLSFYTILSNIAVFAVYVVQARAYLLTARGRPTSVSPWLKGWGMATILITFLVMVFVLGPRNFQMGVSFSVSGEKLVHYITPLLMLADWALFDDHSRYKKSHIISWLCSPVGYFLLTLLLSALGMTYPSAHGLVSRYPYFFIDPDQLGWGQVLINVAVFSALAILLNAAVVGLDNLPAFVAKRRAAKTAK